MSSDIVFINELYAEAIIGIYDFERVQKQPIIISLEMAWDNKPAAKTDDIKHTLDYEKISNSVKELIESSEFELVETLAETITKHIITIYKTNEVTLTLHKPNAIPFTKSVGVKIRRTLLDY